MKHDNKIMKNMKRFTLLLVATTTTVVASAQSGIERLFDDINAMTNKTLLAKSNYEDDENPPTTFCRYDEILMTKTDFGNLDERFLETFSSEKDAYKYYRNTTDMYNAELKLSYGEQNQYNITFGSHSSHNYLVALFRDANHPDKRHAYAVVWYIEGYKVKVLRYHIYGDDPARVSKQRVIRYKGGHLIDDDGGYVLTGLDGLEPQINNDVDFMKRFGTLRASMVSANSADDTLLRTGIVVKIVDLCKKHQHLLTDNERATCQKTIAELIKLYSFEDPYIQGMLEEARLALKK